MIIAGTGHRPPVLFKDNFYSPTNKQKLIAFATDKIDEFAKTWHPRLNGVISGMAQGWDNAIAHAALNLNIPLIAAVPFTGMDSKWPKDSKDDYNYLLSKASEVVIVSEGGYANYKFFLRDQYMVDNCDLLLALYNGNPTGGTAITVKYATTKKTNIVNIWEDWIKNV